MVNNTHYNITIYEYVWKILIGILMGSECSIAHIIPYSIIFLKLKSIQHVKHTAIGNKIKSLKIH